MTLQMAHQIQFSADFSAFVFSFESQCLFSQGPGFLFDHQEEGEAFQFAFPSKSPQTTKEGSGDDFQFSFNF